MSLWLHARKVGSKAHRNRQQIVLRNDIFDCTGYYETKEFFDCHGELHINFSKSNLSLTILYDHKGHVETPKFHVTEEVQKYIEAHKLVPPRLIYQNLIAMADGSQLKNTDLHTITRQQVYNIWMSLRRREWERDPRDDFRSAQMLVEEQEGYILIEFSNNNPDPRPLFNIEGHQEPGVSLAFTTPCFNDKVKYYRSKMTEIFIDSTFALLCSCGARSGLAPSFLSSFRHAWYQRRSLVNCIKGIWLKTDGCSYR
ncbi:hypothetical protein V1522DRAFT_438995 [Lipomyces starkeyi]